MQYVGTKKGLLSMITPSTLWLVVFFHNLVMHSNGWQCICQVLSLLSCSYKHPFGFTRVERHVILFSPFDQFMNTIL